jgi:riboflavin kinase / FMN adenylyltransferase
VKLPIAIYSKPSVKISSALNDIDTPTAIALGNFDGVHRGHRGVIEAVLKRSSGVKTVVSFNPHPQEFFTGQSRQMLTPREEQAEILASLGVEQLVLLPFDRHLVSLTPQAFVTDVLQQQLKAQFVSVGADFRFGNQRAGDAHTLATLAATAAIDTYIAPLALNGEQRVSSSQIRAALLAGNMTAANQLLGRDYQIMGQVVRGQQIGRSIGFPTANIEYPSEKFLPRQGVYCVTADTQLGAALPAVMNLGKRPTVDGTKLAAEVHLLDWQGDLYGSKISLHLLQFLRTEQKFPSLEALTAQIDRDCQAARQFFGHLFSTM